MSGPDRPGSHLPLEGFRSLYDLRLRLQRDEALIELVWGYGILSWSLQGARVLHPLVTTRVQLGFDPESGAISVDPDPLATHMEIDLLQGLGVKGFDLLVNLRDRFPPSRSARSTSRLMSCTSSYWRLSEWTES